MDRVKDMDGKDGVGRMQAWIEDEGWKEGEEEEGESREEKEK